MSESNRSVTRWKLKNAWVAAARQMVGTFALGIIVSIGLLVATIIQHPNPVEATDVAELRLGDLLFFTSTVRVGAGSYFANLELGPGVWLLVLGLPVLVGLIVFVRALYRYGSFVAGVD